jgi:hypothetical protein
VLLLLIGGSSGRLKGWQLQNNTDKCCDSAELDSIRCLCRKPLQFQPQIICCKVCKIKVALAVCQLLGAVGVSCNEASSGLVSKSSSSSRRQQQEIW